jgi:uncharacterized protein (DUF302 family)
METDIGLKLKLKADFQGAIALVTDALKSEGFGVLTEIDVKETMKKKLGVEYMPFMILGACNPNLAHRAITAMPEVSLFLPCNVVVRQVGDQEMEISIFDPMVMTKISDNHELKEIAKEARARLERVAIALQTNRTGRSQ